MGRKAKFTLAQIYEISALKDMKCLSDKYDSNGMVFQCLKCKYIWTARPEDIATCVNADTRGGCPKCYGVETRAEIAIREGRQIAKRRNWLLLSGVDEYKDAHSPLRWKCLDCYHEWPAALSDIKDKPGRPGTGCPKCNNSGTKMIDFIELKNMGRHFGVKSLEKAYENSYTHMKWKCVKRGHSFLRTSDEFQKTPWCSECRAIDRVSRNELRIKLYEYHAMKAKEREKQRSTQDVEWFVAIH